MHHFFQALPSGQCDAKAAPGALIDGALKAGYCVQRPLDQAHNSSERDFIRRNQQPIATGFSSADSKNAGRGKRCRKGFHVLF